MNTAKIAIIDDEQEILDVLSKYFQRTESSYQVNLYQNPVLALEKLDPHTDIVLLDIMMPQMNGLELLPKLQEAYPQIKVIMMTAFSTLDKVLDAHRFGAGQYIMKPFESLKELEKKVQAMLNS